MLRNILVGTFLLCCFFCNAQFSFSVSSGYQFKMGSAKLSDGKVMIDGAGNQGIAIVRYSFGEGYHFSGEAMGHLNENWQIGGKVSYLLGRAFFGYTDIEFQSKMLRFIPQTKFYWHGDQLSAFTSIGLVIGVGQFTEDFKMTSNNTPSGPVTTHRRFKYSDGISFGLNHAVGVEYQTNSNFNFFLQVDSYIQSFGPERRENTIYTINENDLLESLPTSETVVEYLDFLPNGQAQDPDLPDSKLRRIYPFSSVGVSVGVIYDL